MPRPDSVVVALLLAAAAIPQAQNQAVDPLAILALARQALGGEERLSAVRTFVATGRTRQLRGGNIVPIEFEIACEPPDKFARRDEFPAQDAGPVTSGFNRDVLVQVPVPATPGLGSRAGGPAPPTPAQLEAAQRARLTTLKEDVARLMLGLFAGSVSPLPLRFRYAAVAEAPQGQADVIEVTGPSGFTVRFFVDRATHLPIMATWPQPLAGPGRGAPPVGRGPAPQVAGPPSEMRLYFADYRSVDGLKWPFRLRRANGSDTIEETTFDRFRINVNIEPKKFEGQ